MPVISLDLLEPGGEGRIVHVNGRGILRRRILEMGMIPGAAIRCIKRAPLGDPIEFKVKGYNISLRQREARMVLIDSEQEVDVDHGIPLSSVRRKARLKIVDLEGGRGFHRKAFEIGIAKGSEIEVQRVKGGVTVILIDGCEVEIGEGMASKLMVKEV